MTQELAQEMANYIWNAMQDTQHFGEIRINAINENTLSGEWGLSFYVEPCSVFDGTLLRDYPVTFGLICDDAADMHDMMQDVLSEYREDVAQAEKAVDADGYSEDYDTAQSRLRVVEYIDIGVDMWLEGADIEG